MLIISPDTLQHVPLNWPRCFEGEGALNLQQEDLSSLLLPLSGTNWTYNPATAVFKKVGGTSNNYADCNVTFDPGDITGKRPFYFRVTNDVFSTPGGSQNDFSMQFGVVDDAGRRYVMEVAKYCNAQNDPHICGGQNGSNWFFHVSWNGSVVYTANTGVNFNEIFYIESDGLTLDFYHISAGAKVPGFTRTLPDTLHWHFYIAAAYVNNQFGNAQVFKGTLQTIIPITWSAPLGGTLTGETEHEKCFIANAVGNYQVCIDSDYDDPLCTDVVVELLYFYPTNINCGNCVFEKDIVTFTSNGGLEGTLIATAGGDPVGTVLDSLTWEAPDFAVADVLLTYTLGDESRTCTVNVVPKFRVLNVDGDEITGLLPGDAVQLYTTYDNLDADFRWENLDCQALISPRGYLSIPPVYTNDCFGAVDCTIRVRILRFPGAECPNLEPGGLTEFYQDYQVIVDPVFPSINVGGPLAIKQKPEVPDFRVLTKVMEGGCTETHIRNRVPIHRWTVNYDGLSYPDPCGCHGVSCCPDPAGTVEGRNPEHQTAKRLDDFWMLTAGQFKYFTFIDPRTNEVWRRTRFDDVMQRDHINWRNTQSRVLKLIWSPCCTTEVCTHNSCRIMESALPTRNLFLTDFSTSSDILETENIELATPLLIEDSSESIESFSFCDDAVLDFVDVVGITDSVQYGALCKLVFDLKAAGVWDKIVALYPFVGGTALKHSYNLKDTGLYQITWHGGVIHNANGVTGNTTDAYGSTNLWISTLIGLTGAYNSHIALYSRSVGGTSNQWAEAGGNSGGVGLFLATRYSGGDGPWYNAQAGGISTRVLAASSNGSGFFLASRTANNVYKGYKNGATVQTITAVETDDLSSHNYAPYILAMHGVFIVDGPNNFTGSNLAFFSLGAGLNSTEASDYNDAVQTFQTTLGRNI